MWVASHCDEAAGARDDLRSAAIAPLMNTIELLYCNKELGYDRTIADAWSSSAAAFNVSSKPASEPPRQEGGGAHVTYSIGLVSDYRRAGVSRSDGKPALQGSIDVRLPEQWDIGVRGASIARRGNVELTLYGAKTLEVGATDLSIGATFITFPRDKKADYAMFQANASRSIGPIDATIAVLYAPKQGNIDNEDNLYLVARARTPLGKILGAPVTLGANIGRMHGHFADAHSRSDWSLSLAANVGGLDLGLSYVDNDLGDSRGDPAAVISVTRSF